MSFIETHPHEDLKGLVLRPFTFSETLALLNKNQIDLYVLMKAYLGALFFFSLYFLSVLPSSANQWLSYILGVLESAAPQLRFYGLTASDMLDVKVIFGIAVQVGLVGSFILSVFAGSFGLILMAGIFSLWNSFEFKEVFVWVCYAHWLLVFGLVLPNLLGGFVLRLLIFSFLARTFSRKEQKTGFINFSRNYLLVLFVFLAIELLGLSLT